MKAPYVVVHRSQFPAVLIEKKRKWVSAWASNLSLGANALAFQCFGVVGAGARAVQSFPTVDMHLAALEVSADVVETAEAAVVAVAAATRYGSHRHDPH